MKNPLKIAVVGFEHGTVVREIRRAGLVAVKSRPDMVFAFGGDGTFLFSEEKYPGVPKLFVRKHGAGIRGLSKMLAAVRAGEYVIEEFPKLEAAVRGKTRVAMNDINIHYVPPHALRFAVKVGRHMLAENAIGDGVVVATPYGSTGYYRSITRGSFAHGIGLAFNNTTQPMKSPVVAEDSVITVGIARGPGVMAADCDRRIIRLKTGDVIRIRKSIHCARIIHLKGWPLKIVL